MLLLRLIVSWFLADSYLYLNINEYMSHPEFLRPRKQIAMVHSKIIIYVIKNILILNLNTIIIIIEKREKY